MKVEVFQSVPEQARKIRQEVFVEEQGFQNEFDATDHRAVHFVAFDDAEKPIGTCRVFFDPERNSYVLGRLAVRKESRGQKIGEHMVEKAEEYVCKMGGAELQLHAQCRVQGFYQKLGFSAFGDIGDDEGCPHIWMRLALQK